jgi:hypothetical protein
VIQGFTHDAEALSPGRSRAGRRGCHPGPYAADADLKTLACSGKRAFHLEQRDTYNVAAEDDRLLDENRVSAPGRGKLEALRYGIAIARRN